MEYCKVNENKLIKVWYIPEGIPADKIIPERVTEICDHAFLNIREMEEIVIPGTVKIIGKYAFENCSGLKKVELCKGIERVDYGAFANCTSLETLKYGEGIGFTFNVFHNCPKLTYLRNEFGKARCFYFPNQDTFSIAQALYEDNRGVKGYEIFRGRVAEEPFPVGGPAVQRSLYYFVEIKDNFGNKYVYRNRHKDLAIKGAKYMASHQSFSSFFHKKLNLKSHFEYEDFAFLTGVCNFGEIVWHYFLKDCNEEDITVEGVLFILDDVCKILADRLRDALKHQDEEYNFLDMKYYLEESVVNSIKKKMRGNTTEIKKAN